MPTPTTAARFAAEGCLVKPLVYQIFQDPDFSFEFDLRLARPVHRPPDGWFHASSHPMASTRDLWVYMARPEKIVSDPWGYPGLMSALFGTVTHAVMQAALAQFRDLVVPLPEGPCEVCGRPRKPPRGRLTPAHCGEHAASDPETRSRCHVDSILNFGAQGTFGWEFKTIYPMGLHQIPDMDPVFFKEKWPKYWAQNQECMRLTGLRRFIVSFLAMGVPWDMREYHIDFDPAFAAATEAKYRAVLSAQERGLEIVL